MGYYMDQRHYEFFIKAEDVDKAWNSLKELFLKEKKSILDASGYHYAWINTNSVLNAKSFDEAMIEARWDVDRSANNDVDGIWFNGEKYGGDEEIILGAIAPYVRDGSYIEMMGEDGDLWRWCFEDGVVVEKRPEIVWD